MSKYYTPSLSHCKLSYELRVALPKEDANSMQVVHFLERCKEIVWLRVNMIIAKNGK
jgi:hypothetical protein